MPYFIRKPYAATQSAAEAGETPDILALAADVLSRETNMAAASAFRFRAPLRPGVTGSLVLGFTAEQGHVVTRLAITHLTGRDGMIPSHCVTIDPPELSLAPGMTADVTVFLAVPVGVKPGLYRGRISSAGGDGFTAPVEVTVVP